MASSHSPIYAAMHNPSMVDFPGRMAAVFFTSGCNFRCGFCHNATLLGVHQLGYTWDQLEEKCRHYRRNWVRAVVITGGEPTLAEDLDEALIFFRERGFEIKLDTNGSRPQVLSQVLPTVDLVAMDVKCSLERYPDFAGFSDVNAIAESIHLLMGSGTPCEFRTTIIESVHTDAEMHAIGETVRGAPSFAVQAFIPRDDLPDPGLRAALRTSPQALNRAADILRDYVDDVQVRGD